MPEQPAISEICPGLEASQNFPATQSLQEVTDTAAGVELHLPSTQSSHTVAELAPAVAEADTYFPAAQFRQESVGRKGEGSRDVFVNSYVVRVVDEFSYTCAEQTFCRAAGFGAVFARLAINALRDVGGSLRRAPRPCRAVLAVR